MVYRIVGSTEIKIRVKYLGEESGYKQLFREVGRGQARARLFVRYKNAEWYFATKNYEADILVPENVTLQVMNREGKVLFEEKNGNVEPEFEFTSVMAKHKAEEIAEQYNLVSSDTWKESLCLDMKAHNYNGYTDNWLFFETSKLRGITIDRFEYLGEKFVVEKRTMKHKICGRMWVEYLIINTSRQYTEAICGYDYSEKVELKATNQ